MIPMLQAALNGARTGDEHPDIPRTPEELAAAARAAVDVGAPPVPSKGPTLIERTRHPGDPADPRSTNHTRSDPMPAPATLTGQDVGEAEGALTALLNQVLSNTDITRTQYITLRVLALRGPAPSPAELHDYLAGQPQLGLDRSQIAELLLGLEAKGLVAGTPPTDPGPPSSPPRAPPCTPGWPRPSVPSPDACMPTLTQTTLPPPIGCWSRSPNALGAFVTNPEENVSVPPRLNL